MNPPRGEGLDWGVKQSLLNYVASLEDGALEARDGARLEATDTPYFHFGLLEVERDVARTPTVARFMGSISIRGYGGLLSVEFCDPWIQFDSGLPGIVSVLSDHKRVPIVTIDTTPTTASDTDTMFVWNAAPTFLTDDGAGLLGSQYFPGQKVDPLTIRLLRSM